MGCIHQCVFCDQGTITGVNPNSLSNLKIKDTVNSFLQHLSDRRSLVQVSFYGGNFLGLPRKKIKKMLETIVPFIEKKKIDSIRFSTRPDTVNCDTLSKIKYYPIKTIELGVQSMHNDVLRLCKRGHTANNTKNAVSILKQANYQVGIQIMLGLPGDNEKRAIQTTKNIIDLSPDFVRIYPTVVIRNSLLSDMYMEGTYIPLELDTCLSLTKRIFLIFQEHNIPVIRMGLQASKELDLKKNIVAGPYHPAFGHMVYSKVFLDAIRCVILEKISKPKLITIEVNPKNVSRVQGLNCNNLKILKKEFNIISILIYQRDYIDDKSLRICGHYIKIY